MDILKELLEILFMIPEEELPSPELTSEILINSDTKNNTSSLPKDATLDNIFSAEPKLPLPSETFYPSTPSLKEPLSATSKKDPETEELSLELPEPTPPLLDTLKMETKPESDYLPEEEKPSLDYAEPPSESVPEEEEPINPF